MLKGEIPGKTLTKTIINLLPFCSFKIIQGMLFDRARNNK